VEYADKAPIRQKLSQVLNRRFSLGGTSFALDAEEAQQVLQYGKTKEHIGQYLACGLGIGGWQQVTVRSASEY